MFVFMLFIKFVKVLPLFIQILSLPPLQFLQRISQSTSCCPTCFLDSIHFLQSFSFVFLRFDYFKCPIFKVVDLYSACSNLPFNLSREFFYFNYYSFQCQDFFLFFWGGFPSLHCYFHFFHTSLLFLFFSIFNTLV